MFQKFFAVRGKWLRPPADVFPPLRRTKQLHRVVRPFARRATADKSLPAITTERPHANAATALQAMGTPLPRPRNDKSARSQNGVSVPDYVSNLTCGQHRAGVFR